MTVSAIMITTTPALGLTMGTTAFAVLALLLPIGSEAFSTPRSAVQSLWMLQNGIHRRHQPSIDSASSKSQQPSSASSIYYRRDENVAYPNQNAMRNFTLPLPVETTNPIQVIEDQHKAGDVVVDEATEMDSNDGEYNWMDEWYPVTFASHIPNPSESPEVTPLTVFGHSLALWREQDDGPIQCADDKCPHRAAALTQGRINAEDGTLECNYHGWHFRGSPPADNPDHKPGAAVSIPHLQSGACIPKKACLQMHPCQEIEGVVWVWMGKDRFPFKDPPPSLTPDAWGEQKTYVCQEFQYDIPVNHVYVTENVLDPAHVHIVHDGEKQGGDRDKAAPLEMNVDKLSPRGFEGRYRDTSQNSSHWNQINFHAPATVHFVAPFSRGTGVLEQEIHITPISKSMSRLLIRAYIKRFPKFLHMMISSMPKWMNYLASCRIIEQDIPLLATQEANVLGSEIRDPLINSNNEDALLGSADKFILGFRRWLKEFAKEMPFNQAIVPENKVDEESNHDALLSHWEEPPNQGPSSSVANLHSRYHMHVKNSPVARQALKRVKQAKRIATFAAISSALGLVTTHANVAHAAASNVGASLARAPYIRMLHRFLLGSTVVSVAAVPTLHKIENSFYKTFDWRQELRSLPRRSRWWSVGSNVAFTNIGVNAAILGALMKYRQAFSPLCLFALLNNYAGQFFDNAVRARGKDIGEGPKLRRLNKVGLMLHGSGTPMLGIPITEIAAAQGLIGAKAKKALQVFWLAFSSVELVRWALFDSSKLKVVDSRRLKRHAGQSLAGTLSYTSGKVLACLVPVFAVLMFELGAGSALLAKASNARAAKLLLLSGFASIVSCSMNRADVQLLGEALHIGSIYAILAFLA